MDTIVIEKTQVRQAVRSAEMQERARLTTAFLKSLAHPARLVILCRLAEGAATVGELEVLLALPQAAVSKHLARLRDEGLVAFERDGRSIVYTLADARTRRIIGTLYDEFCV
jgi:ArsR family transcriptional regulator, virulence genes transcriptional regulator